MGLDLYYMEGSPPCRAVLLTARALGVTLNLKTVSIFEKDHLTPEFLKISPQHTVPTLVDDGFVVAESRAIVTYLVDRFAKGNPLYPEDLKTRNVVNQRLYYDVGTFYPGFQRIYHNLMDKKPEDPAMTKKAEDALVVLNSLLEGKKYIAGANLTVADLVLATSFSYFELLDIDHSKHDNIKRWYTAVQSNAPGWEELTSKDLDLAREWFARQKKSQ